MFLRKILLFLINIILIVNISFSQRYTQQIKGIVIDSDTRQPLWGANVLIINSNPLKGSTTDEQGRFKIENVEIGRKSIKISYIGYEENVIPEILVGSGKEINLTIEIKEKIISAKEVVISAGRERTQPINAMAGVSSRVFSVDDASRYAGGLSDPSRMASAFAGVNAADDENNEIIIRGNSPRGILWKLEGVEIPNPNHFRDGEGASGGGVSILSNNMMSNSDFFTGAFPAEYGNASSGVFDIRLRTGNTNKREYSFQLGVVGAEASIEGPFVKGKQASYLINYRNAIFELINKLGIKTSDNFNEIVPAFQDLSFNLNFPTKNAGNFSLFGLGGKSTAGQLAEKDSSLWEEKGDRFEETEYHKTGVLGITNLYRFRNNKSYIKTVFSVSGESNTLENDSLNNNYSKIITHNEKFTYTSARLSTMFNHKFNSKNFIRTGLIYSISGYDINMEGVDWNNNMQWRNWINSSGNTSILQTYMQWQHRFTDKIELNSGLHFLHFALNNNYSIEPRLGLKFNISALHSIQFGFGIHSKVESISNYMIESKDLAGNLYVPNKNLDFTKSTHYIVGYHYQINESMRFKAEIYYQYLYDVPVSSDSGSILSALNFNEGIADIPLVNNGKGYNYGLELTLEKFLSNHYYFLFTSSLFDSKFKTMDGKWRNTYFNNSFVFNLLAGKDFVFGSNKNKTLSINAKLLCKGGNRFIPIDLQASNIKGYAVYIVNNAYNERIADYYRFDLGLKYRKDHKNFAWIISLDIQNVTSRQNLYGQYYDAYAKKIAYSYHLGMLPILNFRIEF